MILDQRSEVEQFFLEALEQIKEEIRKKNIIEQRQKKMVSNPANTSNMSRQYMGASQSQSVEG